MRILFLSHYFPPEVNAPAVRTHEHCREWVRAGHEVHVLTCVPSHPQGRVYPGYRTRFGVQHETVDGLRVHRVWTHVAPNRGVWRRTIGYVSFMLSAAAAAPRLPRPDVIVATSPQFFCACAGGLVSKLFGRPWVFELRDLWPDSVAAVGAVSARAALRFFEHVELSLYRDAAGIVALTHAFRDNLCARGVPGEKVHVVTNGVDADCWPADADRGALRASLGLNNGFVAAYVGTHGMAHNLETLLEAARLLRDDGVRFVTVGDGAEFARLQQLRGAMGLDNVEMVGQVPRDAAQRYLLAADASLVLLRRSDLFTTVIPSKIFEAMAAGRPIILGVDSEARRIVEDSQAGIYVGAENPRALADAVLRLRADPELARRMGECGRRAVRTHYDRRALATRMLRILEHAARPGRRRS